MQDGNGDGDGRFTDVWLESDGRGAWWTSKACGRRRRQSGGNVWVRRNDDDGDRRHVVDGDGVRKRATARRTATATARRTATAPVTARLLWKEGIIVTWTQRGVHSDGVRGTMTVSRTAKARSRGMLRVGKGAMSTEYVRFTATAHARPAGDGDGMWRNAMACRGRQAAGLHRGQTCGVRPCHAQGARTTARLYSCPRAHLRRAIRGHIVAGCYDRPPNGSPISRKYHK